MQKALSWYALRVKSNFERITADSLVSRGYEEFTPFYQQKRRWSDRTKVVDIPLFAGYVFCRFDMRKRLPVLQAPGIISIVSFGGEPAPVDDTEIEAIRLAFGSANHVQPWPYLREGQKVRMAAGALQGLEGILVSQKNQNRIIVSVTLLQRSVGVEVNREDIEPVL